MTCALCVRCVGGSRALLPVCLSWTKWMRTRNFDLILSKLLHSMDVVVKCAKSLYNKRYAVSILEHCDFIKWSVIFASDFSSSQYWVNFVEFFGKMWCLISQANSVVFEVRVDPKAIGQECLEKVSFYPKYPVIEKKWQDLGQFLKICANIRTSNNPDIGPDQKLSHCLIFLW